MRGSPPAASQPRYIALVNESTGALAWSRGRVLYLLQREGRSEPPAARIGGLLPRVDARGG